MGKGIKKPPKKEKDFRKQRLKVGRTLSRAHNETTVNVRVAKLALPEAYQSTTVVDGQKQGQASLPVCSRYRPEATRCAVSLPPSTRTWPRYHADLLM